MRRKDRPSRKMRRKDRLIRILLVWAALGLVSVPLLLSTDDDDTAAFGATDLAVLSSDAAYNMMPGFDYSRRIRKGIVSKQRVVTNSTIGLPDYAKDGRPKYVTSESLDGIDVKTKADIEKMRAAGKLARKVLDLAGRAVAVGITTDEIDTLVHNAIISAGAYPTTLNYMGFPKSCATSVNEVVCHGIPDSRKLENGDIINIDVSVYLEGFHADVSEMFVVGKASPSTKQLLQTTYDSWIKACNYVQPGNDYRDLGGIIEDYILAKGYSSVKEYAGHGIGKSLHSAPCILHVHNSHQTDQMAVGHVFTVEPMICQGSAKVVTWPDHWTVTTADGKWSAQFEHTLLVTPDGVEALTAKNQDSMLQFWETESEVHKGFWMGTSKEMVQLTSVINNAKLNH